MRGLHSEMAFAARARSVWLIHLHWCVMAALVLCSLQGVFAPDEHWAGRLAWAGLVVLGLQMAYVARRSAAISFELWFLVASWLFMFGQVWLIGLGRAEYLFYPLLLRYDTAAITEAAAFALCYLQALFLGLTGSQYVLAPGPRMALEVPSGRALRLSTSIGTALVLFALPFRLSEDYRNVVSAQASGSFLSVTTSSGAADDLGKLLVPGLLALIVGARHQPGPRRLYLLAGAGYHLAVMVLSGDRRYAMTALLALGLGYVASLGLKRSWRILASSAVAGLLLLNVLAYIRSIRQGGLTSLGAVMRDAPAQLVALNPVVESLSEFGVSLMSVVLAVIYVPDIVPYQSGFSYLGALGTLLPIGWLGDNAESVSVGDTLAQLDGHPVGASQAAELFANFGWWGLLGGLFLGRVLSWTFAKARSLASPINIVVYYSLFYILLNLVRAAFVEVLRASILVSIPVIVLAAVLRQAETRRVGIGRRRW